MKCPAYETPLTKNEIDKWRKEFWGKLSKYYFIIRGSTQFYKAYCYYFLKKDIERL